MRAFPPLLLALFLTLALPSPALAGDHPLCDDVPGNHCDETDCFVNRPMALVESPVASALACVPEDDPQ